MERRDLWLDPPWTGFSPSKGLTLSPHLEEWIAEGGGQKGKALWSKIEKKHRQNSHPINHCPIFDHSQAVKQGFDIHS